MGQLLKFSTAPFQAVHFTQNARLVPSSMVDVERRKALARHNAFTSRSSGASADLSYVSRINRAFSAKQHVAAPAPNTNAPVFQRPSGASYKTAPAVSAQPAYNGEPVVISSGSASMESYPSAPVQSSIDVQTQSAYAAQRGAFELRVAKGELSYVPAMVMTIITQYPEVNFEYVGGFNYVPPDWNELPGSTMNFSV